MESKPNICSSCNVAFISLRSLEIHLRFLHKKNNFESKKAKTICKYCSQPYSTIKKHEKRCEEFYKIFVRNETECMICQESYTSIRKHLSAKHGYEMAQIQGSCVSMRNKQYNPAHRIFLCNICDQVFRQKKSMLDHRMSIHEGVKYQCERCPKKFAWKTALDSHIRDKHLFKYKMQCLKCNKTFVSKKGLDYHLRISCEEKPSVDKPFDCDNCEQKFASGDSLWHHKNTFHKGKRYNCTKCDRQFLYSSVLQKHIKAKHDKINYPCLICKKKFAYKSGLSYHEKMYH